MAELEKIASMSTNQRVHTISTVRSVVSIYSSVASELRVTLAIIYW